MVHRREFSQLHASFLLVHKYPQENFDKVQLDLRMISHEQQYDQVHTRQHLLLDRMIDEVDMMYINLSIIDVKQQVRFYRRQLEDQQFIQNDSKTKKKNYRRASRNFFKFSIVCGCLGSLIISSRIDFNLKKEVSLFDRQSIENQTYLSVNSL